LKGLNVEESLDYLRSLEYKLFDVGSTINFGGFLALKTALMDALVKVQNKIHGRGLRYKKLR